MAGAAPRQSHEEESIAALRAILEERFDRLSNELAALRGAKSPPKVALPPQEAIAADLAKLAQAQREHVAMLEAENKRLRKKINELLIARQHSTMVWVVCSLCIGLAALVLVMLRFN